MNDVIDNPTVLTVKEGGDHVTTIQIRDQIVVRVDESKILETEKTEQLIVEQDSSQIHILAVGAQGPAGTDGVDAGGQIIKTAAVSLGGHRAVVLDASGEAIYADSSTLTHRDKVLGITTGAASAGAVATIQTYGEITEPSWTWTLDDPVFLGLTGLLTQTPPSSGFVQRIGFPTATTSLFIDIDDAITL